MVKYRILNENEGWKKAPLVDKRLELQNEAIKRVKKEAIKRVKKDKKRKFKMPDSLKKKIRSKRVFKRSTRPTLVIQDQEVENIFEDEQRFFKFRRGEDI